MMPYWEEMIRLAYVIKNICRREKSTLSELGLRGLRGPLKKLY